MFLVRLRVARMKSSLNYLQKLTSLVFKIVLKSVISSLYSFNLSYSGVQQYWL